MLSIIGGEGGIGFASQNLFEIACGAPSPVATLLSSNFVFIPRSLREWFVRLCRMAEREGFEPSVPFPAHILSRDAQSATLSPLLGKLWSKLALAHRSIHKCRNYCFVSNDAYIPHFVLLSSRKVES